MRYFTLPGALNLELTRGELGDHYVAVPLDEQDRPLVTLDAVNADLAIFGLVADEWDEPELDDGDCCLLFLVVPLNGDDDWPVPLFETDRCRLAA